jgi:tetratricopeptide (TPR) repeat protein
MAKPCFKCDAFNKNLDECGVLKKLRALSLDKLDGPQERDEKLANRKPYINDLFFDRPCEFSSRVMSKIGYFMSKRGLKLQNNSDIHNDVVINLMEVDFRRIEPDYDDFRRYLAKMIRSAIQRDYSQRYGNHCCGACAFFLEGNKRCLCPDLKPAQGQKYINVNYSTNPKAVIHGGMYLLGADDILDWSRLCARLGNAGDRVNPASRIWESMPQETRLAILNAVKTNEFNETFKRVFLESLNGILARRDFYQEIYFKGINITGEAEELLKRSEKGLSDREAQRLNRLIIERACPQEIARSRKGCSHYSSRQVVDLDHWKEIYAPEANEVENTLRHMESLGPRQRKLVKLLRIMLEGHQFEEDGYEISEVARRIGKHRTTIPKDLYGTTEKEKDDRGKKITYHQAGAFDIFRAIYTGAIFTLKQKNLRLWSIVNRRDFSPDAIQPSFKKIANEFGISKREAIERYIEGWDFIKPQPAKGDGNMSRFETDEDKQKPEPLNPKRLIARASEILHPDAYLLLTYAEGGLDRNIRTRIAGHILICESCSAELENIELEFLGDADYSARATKPLGWMSARLFQLTRKASRAGDTGRAGAAGWFDFLSLPASLKYQLAATAIAMASILIWWEARYSGLNRDLSSMTKTIESLKHENESFEQENAMLLDKTEKAEKAIIFDEQLRQLLTDKQTALERKISQLQNQNNGSKPLPPKLAMHLRSPVKLQDVSGVMTIDNDGSVSFTEPDKATQKLPASIAQSVAEFVATGAVTPAEPKTVAIASNQGSPTRGGIGEGPALVPLSPALTAVRSTNPTLRWEPTPGAQRYKITIAYPKNKENGRVIRQEIVESQTQLTLPSGALKQGQIYFWQVETVVEGRVRISPAVGFWALSEKTLHAVEAVERDYNSSALTLASVYAKYGLYEEALSQIERLAALNPNNPAAQMMLQRLRRQLGKD